MTAPTQTIPDIDHLSVIKVVHDGMRLRLKGPERDEAIRRMHRRVGIDIRAPALLISTLVTC